MTHLTGCTAVVIQLTTQVMEFPDKAKVWPETHKLTFFVVTKLP
jgi:hypothetical protein